MRRRRLQCLSAWAGCDSRGHDLLEGTVGPPGNQGVRARIERPRGPLMSWGASNSSHISGRKDALVLEQRGWERTLAEPLNRWTLWLFFPFQVGKSIQVGKDMISCTSCRSCVFQMRLGRPGGPG